MTASAWFGEIDTIDASLVLYMIDLGYLPIIAPLGLGPQGQALGENNLSLLQAYLHNDEIAIRVSLGLGDAKATVWGCDLTPDYIRINGTYTT